MYAKLRGTEIYYDISGMGLEPQGDQFVEKPVLFMLHGGPGGDHLRFKQHSIDLNKVAQLVFIDHRGCGRSKKTKAKDYTLENNIEDIEALRKHLGLKKISILGASYGGIVAQGYAIRYPKNVDKLILSATAPSYRFIEEAKQIIETNGTRKQNKLALRLWNGSFKNVKQVNEYFKAMETLYSVKAKKKKKPTPKSATIWSYQALNQGFGGFLRNFDFTNKLKKIRARTLILAGEKDWICNAKQAKVMAKHIPHAKLKIFKNCGHSLAVDAHNKYIKTIQRFFHTNK